MAKDNTWFIEISKFYAGYSPLAFSNSLTELGAGGSSSIMQNVDVINGTYLTQGPGLTNLTNGTQAGVVTQQIQYIMDRAVSADVSYAIGTTKLFKISSTAVTNDGTFPHTITSCAEGESIQVLGGNLYYFYNTASAGDIGKYDLASTFDDDWGSTAATGAAALQLAPHPSDKKEDIIVFGNGRYAGTFVGGGLTVNKLDFGIGTEVADVLYNAGFWYIAVNTGTSGSNRNEGQVYLYDGAALLSTLSDEAGVGFQKIGFLHRINGIVYIAYQDLSFPGFIIGYLNGKSITPLKRFTGTLPTFAQKTLYNNTILFISSGLIYSAGAVVGDLPYQLSQYADGGYATVGAIAAPFGTPIVSSTDGGSNFRLSKFSGYDTNCNWKSIVFPVSSGLNLAEIESITVFTKALGASASCSLTVETNQGVNISSAKTITTTGKTRHYFDNFGLADSLEDFRIALDWSGGSTSNDCAIRKIIIKGNYLEG